MSPSQVVIRDTESERSCGIRSLKGLGINDIRIMGRTNRYGKDRKKGFRLHLNALVVAYTPHTLILADMETDKV